MENSIEKVLKKIELLEKQDLQKEKMLKELREDLLRLNAEGEMTKEPAAKETDEIKEGQNSEADMMDAMEVVEEIVDLDEPMLIVIAGVDKRSGTTHHAIETAGFFARQGKRTAIMEFNRSGGFDAIARYIGKQEDGEFLFRNIIFYPDCTLQMLEKVSASGEYDFIVLDLGRYKEEKTLFSRSDLKIMVASGRPWELDSLQPVFDKLKKSILKETYFFFNFVSSDESEREKIRQGMGELQNIFFADFVSNPFMQSDDNLEMLLSEYIDTPDEVTGKEKNKLVSLFRRNQNEKNGERRTKGRYHFIRTLPRAEC